jgi:hypothetical protein
MYTVLRDHTFFFVELIFVRSPLFTPTMTTSADDWISSFSSLAVATSPSSSQPSPGVTILSGVSSSSGEYGGGAKRATLFYFDASATALCLGFVGSGCKRFCLKVVSGDSGTCGVAKHSHKFIPSHRHYYLRGVDSTAYCEPTLSQDIVPEEFRGTIGLTAKSMTEWKDVFRAYAEDISQGSPLQARLGLPSIVLKTPKKDRNNGDSFANIIIPTELRAMANQVDDLPGSAFWWEDDGVLDVLPSSLVSFLQDLRSFLLKFDQWLLHPHDISTARMDIIADDFHQLRLFCQNLASQMGRSMLIQGQEFPDIWCGIDYLTTLVIDKSPSAGLADLRSIIGELQASISDMTSLSATVAKCEADILHHAGRFQFIKPILLSANTLAAQLPVLTSRLDVLEANVRRVQPATASPPRPHDSWTQSFAPSPDLSPSSSSSSGSPPGVTPSSSFDGEARLNTLEHLVKSLEKRIVGDGIRVGRFLFQSKEDLRLWLLQHVQNNRFGLFLDAVSIFDFLAQAHVDSESNMSHLYNSQKNGFDTTYESRIISSMQNLFPNLFGKASADGLDTSRALPGLQSADKWNSEGVTGLQLQVERELPNVDLQFRNAIASTFEDSIEARDLSLELLYRSKKFAQDLCHFIQRDFEFWLHKKYSKKDAWELTCLSVRRIFEDIHVVRVVGRDSRDLKNPSLTATQVLWATLKAHTVMEEYSRRNFFEHPSISAVIAWHLASNHTKPDATLEGKHRTLDERVIKLSSKVDGIESRLVVINSKLERLASIETRLLSLEEQAKNSDPFPQKKARGGGKNKTKGADVDDS